MVSIAELIEQRKGELSTVEQQLQAQSQLISEQERRSSRQEEEFLEATRPRAVTLERQASLAQAFGFGGIPRGVTLIRRAKRKARKEARPKFRRAREETARAREEIASERARLQPIRKEIREVEEFERGRQLASVSGGVFGLETELEREGFRAGVEQVKGARARVELLKVGIPIFTGGRLTGFRKDSQEVPLELLPIEDLESLQRGGILTFTPREIQQPQPIEQIQTPLPPKITAREFFFGEAGKPFVGVDIVPPFLRPRLIGKKVFDPRPDISFQEIADVSRRAGLPGKVFAELLPTTPGEVAITGGLAGAVLFAPPIVGGLISGGVAFLGGRTALDPSLAPETRIAGGIVGGLGLAGVVSTATPFVRGLGARLSPRFRGVRTAPEGFQIIPEVPKIGDIGLIRPGRGDPFLIDLPATSPLRRGGFGVREFEKLQFLGEEQLLATSQRGFFRTGRDIPIQREFFVTPQEPTFGIPETRVSRLGLIDPFKFPSSIEIGFGIPPSPQIGVTLGAVGRTQARGRFAIGRGSELEAIRTTGIITDVTPVAPTIIRGQRVDVFTFRVGEGIGRPGRPGVDLISTRPVTRVSGESLFASLGLGARTTTNIVTSFPTLDISRSTPSLVSPTITTTGFPSLSLVPSISPRISPPVSPGISPQIIPQTPTSFPSIPLSPRERPPTPPKRRRRVKRGGVSGYNVFVKSKGKFQRTNKKPIRRENALSEGAFLTDHSTSRQFKIKKSKTRIKKPKKVDPYFNQNRFKFREFKQRGKERALTPNNFIELSNFAIDTPNEVKGIPLKGVLEQRRRRASGIKIKRKKRKTSKRKTPRRNVFGLRLTSF